jgi:thiamine-phosphate pyrophosphorylase
LRINKKKFIYLISPKKIKKSFYDDLIEILKNKKVGIFQLRLKNTSFKKKLIIGKKIQKICKKYNTKF